LATPRLVVASASKPSAANILAVPASQGLGMMKAPGRSCRARNIDAFSAWLRIGLSIWSWSNQDRSIASSSAEITDLVRRGVVSLDAAGLSHMI
jgi:hypothetical protein